MEYISTEEFCLTNTCVTLGKFDGIHLGHRLLLRRLAQEKEESGAKSVVFTFACHPGLYFAGGGQLIYTEEEKKAVLKDAGVDILISYPFTKETSAMEAEDFIERIFAGKLGAKLIAVGCDNRFGHNRRGDATMLHAYSKKHGFRVAVCEQVKDGADIISSTLIKQEMKNGNIERVNRMLGAPYYISGRLTQVVPPGKAAGFGAASLAVPKEKQLPLDGAYATKAILPSKAYDGITFIASGAQGKKQVKTLLFHCQESLHEKAAKIEFHHFLGENQGREDAERIKF